MKIAWEGQIGERPELGGPVPASSVGFFLLVFGLLADADVGQLPAADGQAFCGVVVDGSTDTAGCLLRVAVTG